MQEVNFVKRLEKEFQNTVIRPDIHKSEWAKQHINHIHTDLKVISEVYPKVVINTPDGNNAVVVTFAPKDYKYAAWVLFSVKMLATPVFKFPNKEPFGYRYDPFIFPGKTFLTRQGEYISHFNPIPYSHETIYEILKSNESLFVWD